MKKRILITLVAAVLAVAIAIPMGLPVAANGVGPVLAARWNFNETSGTVAHDMTTNHNNGTLMGTFGNALSFDGTDDYVQVGDLAGC